MFRHYRIHVFFSTVKLPDDDLPIRKPPQIIDTVSGTSELIDESSLQLRYDKALFDHHRPTIRLASIFAGSTGMTHNRYDILIHRIPTTASLKYIRTRQPLS